MSIEFFSTLCGIVLAPFAALLLIRLTNPIAAFISKHLREGWLKRFLFISWKV